VTGRRHGRRKAETAWGTPVSTPAESPIPLLGAVRRKRRAACSRGVGLGSCMHLALRRAVAAEPVERDVVVGDSETLGGHGGDGFARAVGQVEGAVAAVAVEVVVVAPVGGFVAGLLTWELNLLHEAFVLEESQRSVDRGKADARELLPGEVVQFGGAERASLVLDDASENFALLG